jgi:hypothetical protein
MTLVYSQYMYNKPYGFDTTDLNFDDVSNKLFCTFSELDEIDNLIDNIQSQYTVLYNKIFVLQIKSSNEYVCTYNIDYSNLNEIPENTILVHRKKETNTLYTINALNELIKKLNGGVVDVTYRINWIHYRNCILLTQHNELKQLNTKVYKIVEL